MIDSNLMINQAKHKPLDFSLPHVFVTNETSLFAQLLASNHTLRVVIVAHHEAVHHSVGANRNALGNHHLSR